MLSGLLFLAAWTAIAVIGTYTASRLTYSEADKVEHDERKAERKAKKDARKSPTVAGLLAAVVSIGVMCAPTAQAGPWCQMSTTGTSSQLQTCQYPATAAHPIGCTETWQCTANTCWQAYSSCGDGDMSTLPVGPRK